MRRTVFSRTDLRGRTAFVLAALLLGPLTVSSGCSLGRHPESGRRGGGLEPLGFEACRRKLAGDPEASALRRGAERSVEHLRKQPGDRPLPLLGRSVTVAQVRRNLDIIVDELRDHPDDWASRVCRRLTLYRVQTESPILVTAYYRPLLAARRRRDARFRYPVYGPPSRPVHESRAQIDAGALDGHVPVLAWVEDPVDLFFLQIQGSGVLQLGDGDELPIGYAASNGRPYRSIGSLMVEQGRLKPGTASMQAIKAYIHAHPAERDAILHANERYVFFQPSRGGPVGSLGAPLTPGHSIAADPNLYPAGAAAWIDPGPTAPPGVGPRLVFIQDTGSAITGPAHVDLFLGTGDEAGALAGRTRARGDLYLLLDPE